MSIVMNNPQLNGVGNNLLENYGASTLTGAGYIFKFATEDQWSYSRHT